MKNILITVSLLCTLGILGVVACKKNNTTATPSSQSLAEVFSDLKYSPQNINVYAGRDTIVYGTKGTMFHFYANSFKDINGKIITTGIINLALIEMYKPVDMICNRASTTANGAILQSGGQVKVIATMAGKPVFANKYGIGFPQSKASTLQMQIFQTNSGDTSTNWTMADTTQKQGTTAYQKDSTRFGTFGKAYVFDSTPSFNYINCDRFYGNDSPKTSVGIVLPDTTFNPMNTQAYLIFPDINAAITSSNYYFRSSGDSTYNWDTHVMKIGSFNYLNRVPTGLNYAFVVITNKNGTYYFYQTSGKTKMNMVLTASMVMDTHADIVARLGAL